ncbi:HepT-like ribonuclease domain-containing protein [uncultured Nitrosomonas sp.]|uniref:HepT-like ribonuclease domain-containing protein n=1 Tax=uncultured Nitrosomonas sp. TaxID=156424 RepID=UPI0025E4ED0D|nr:HepT-like ribonuclease domain-containing protein [uncultured Nitrosomonas sp.]
MFILLAHNEWIDTLLTDNLKRMVGFRNIAAHDYQVLQNREIKISYGVYSGTLISSIENFNIKPPRSLCFQDNGGSWL